MSFWSTIRSDGHVYRSPPREPTFEISTTYVKELLDRESYDKILESKELFFAAFFLNETEDRDVEVDDNQNKITFRWDISEHDQLSREIESFRVILVKPEQVSFSLESGNHTNVFVYTNEYDQSFHYECPTFFQARSIRADDLFLRQFPKVLNALHVDYTIQDCLEYGCGVNKIDSNRESLKRYTIRRMINLGVRFKQEALL